MLYYQLGGVSPLSLRCGLAVKNFGDVLRLNGWRVALPLVQLVASVSLIWYGCWYRPAWQHWVEEWISPTSEPSEVYFGWIDGIEPISEQIASGLNFPAAAAAALSLAPLVGWLNTGASRELAFHFLTALYIPLLWYWIGKRIDRRREISAAPLSKRTRTLAVISISGLGFLGLLILLNLAIDQRYTTSILALLWVVFGITAIGFRLPRFATHFRLRKSVSNRTLS